MPDCVSNSSLITAAYLAKRGLIVLGNVVRSNRRSILSQTYKSLEKFPTRGVVAERITQPGTRPAQSRFDGSHRDTGDRGNVVVRIAVHVGEDHDQPLIIGQG